MARDRKPSVYSGLVVAFVVGLLFGILYDSTNSNYGSAAGALDETGLLAAASRFQALPALPSVADFSSITNIQLEQQKSALASQLQSFLRCPQQ